MAMRRWPAKPDEITAVRALRRKGLSLMEIARETGLSKSAIGRITADMPVD
jgi:transcriptional regulator with XRE-family HTH domain